MKVQRGPESNKKQLTTSKLPLLYKNAKPIKRAEEGDTPTNVTEVKQETTDDE